jgi:Protein of unknown function (DUF3341)
MPEWTEIDARELARTAAVGAGAKRSPENEVAAHLALAGGGRAPRAREAASAARRWVLGVFTEEVKLLDAVRRVRAAGFAVHDVYTPYAVHGLDEAMGLRRSRLGRVTMAGGLVGLASAVGLQVWCAVVDWPLDVGGKPANSALAFVPISFELTILCAGLATAAAFLWRSRLHPPLPQLGIAPAAQPAADLVGDVTDDTFVVALACDDEAREERAMAELLLASGAERVETERRTA